MPPQNTTAAAAATYRTTVLLLVHCCSTRLPCITAKPCCQCIAAAAVLLPPLSSLTGLLPRSRGELEMPGPGDIKILDPGCSDLDPGIQDSEGPPCYSPPERWAVSLLAVGCGALTVQVGLPHSIREASRYTSRRWGGTTSGGHQDTRLAGGGVLPACLHLPVACPPGCPPARLLACLPYMAAYPAWHAPHPTWHAPHPTWHAPHPTWNAPHPTWHAPHPT